MGIRLGKHIKAARTEAGFTQEQLAKKVRGVTASEIGRYERGEAEPTQETVKAIAKACGVTQKSLLDAMPKSTSSRSHTSTSSSTASKTSMQVTNAERTLVELYRRASSADKKKAVSVLRGNDTDLGDIFEGLGALIGESLKK